MTAPRLDVVIVNWNSGDLLRACLASLDASRDAEALRVVVVDNASTDDSLADLPASRHDLVVLRNRDNLGFGRACNLGAATGRAPAILFLNPDTRVEPDSLWTALAALDGDMRVGVVGAQLRDADGSIQRSCAREPTAASLLWQALSLDRILPWVFPPHFMREWDHARSRSVDQVMGAFLMIERRLFDTLGGFDEDFFVYYEDVDLCTRVRTLGFRVRHVAEAPVWHRGQGTTEAVRERRLFYYLRGQIQYALKHHGLPAAAALAGAVLLGQIPLRLARAALRRNPEEARQVVGAARLLVRALPAILLPSRHTPRPIPPPT
ncbi:glycosyltransferase family 2 protein [Methylobacterium oryzihabitans]|uniref:Glycosyltransferase family 2 protein n=1 Tax=Methylobacterium oryzihabitans TaxID=2499852 RepID=A0A437PHP0_9HYPH|nr:glycosyltransferase family 2 protein [Methylobacterium oryzihabitans]RVU21737.1 glycosyltransferase family 2 protein [Methylobacterium oryzihabitans]